MVNMVLFWYNGNSTVGRGLIQIPEDPGSNLAINIYLVTKIEKKDLEWAIYKGTECHGNRVLILLP